MPTREQLAEDARALSDVELLNRLRGKGLTELASEVDRDELTARGVDVERALRELAQTSPEAQMPMGINVQVAHTVLRRILRFPLRAVLGVDPLWAVVLFGGTIVFGVWKLVRWGLGQLAASYPIPPYALPVGYGALGVFALVVAWWGVALWRTGGQSNGSLAQRSFTSQSVLSPCSS